ncbi:uncharacterized protein rbpms isoform X1 [Cyprinus carpio]|uniref:Uncharacterized protein rbpms isoform X1 n=1 Tax=Cyprinus carpio TaxID=7962 RepID=A0A9R0AZM7_CYPCA|nr:uncharacterized protein rbpms isoform X1 [Cyprinus carpio]
MFNVSMKTKTSFPVNGPRARRLYDAPSVRARDLTAGARQKTDVRELMSLILYFCPRMNNTSENEPNSPEEESFLMSGLCLSVVCRWRALPVIQAFSGLQRILNQIYL